MAEFPESSSFLSVSSFKKKKHSYFIFKKREEVTIIGEFSEFPEFPEFLLFKNTFLITLSFFLNHFYLELAGVLDVPLNLSAFFDQIPLACGQWPIIICVVWFLNITYSKHFKSWKI